MTITNLLKFAASSSRSNAPRRTSSCLYKNSVHHTKTFVALILSTMKGNVTEHVHKDTNSRYVIPQFVCCELSSISSRDNFFFTGACHPSQGL